MTSTWLLPNGCCGIPIFGKCMASRCSPVSRITSGHRGSRINISTSLTSWPGRADARLFSRLLAHFINVCEHFGNSLVQVHRDLLFDLDNAVQSTSQRHVFDGGDIMFPAHFFDLLG